MDINAATLVCSMERGSRTLQGAVAYWIVGAVARCNLLRQPASKPACGAATACGAAERALRRQRPQYASWDDDLVRELLAIRYAVVDSSGKLKI